MEENPGSRYLTTFQQTLAKLGDTGLHVNNSGVRIQCAERATELRKKPIWTLSDVEQLAFYDLASNADPARHIELTGMAVARFNACHFKLMGENPAYFWRWIGIQPNTPEAEVLKAKETAAALLCEVKRVQEEASAKVKESLAKAAASDAEHLVTLDKLAEADAKYQSSMKSLETERTEKVRLQAELQAERQNLEKVRAELQTALSAQATRAPGDIRNAAVLSKELSLAHKMIEQQQQLIDKYRTAPKDDGELKDMLDSIIRNWEDPERKTETKAGLHFVRYVILGD